MIIEKMLEYLMIKEIIKSRSLTEDEFIPLEKRMKEFEDEFVNQYKLRDTVKVL